MHFENCNTVDSLVSFFKTFPLRRDPIGITTITAGDELFSPALPISTVKSSENVIEGVGNSVTGRNR